MKIEDLIILYYPGNKTEVAVMKVEEKDVKTFKIDLENKTWTYQDGKEYSIGETRTYDKSKGKDFVFFTISTTEYPTIGIYDSKNMYHLTKMVKDGKEFTSIIKNLKFPNYLFNK